jgi:hypothetical protein
MEIPASIAACATKIKKGIFIASLLGTLSFGMKLGPYRPAKVSRVFARVCIDFHQRTISLVKHGLRRSCPGLSTGLTTACVGNVSGARSEG